MLTKVGEGCRSSPKFGALGPVSRKSRKLFGPESTFVKLRPAYSVKLAFSYVVKGWKIKITVKFHSSRRKKFRDFRETGPWSLCDHDRVLEE